METQPAANSDQSCVEHGVWTPVPREPPASLEAFTLDLHDVDAAQHDGIVRDGRMTFHAVGCTGDYANHQPGRQVAAAMAAQIDSSGAPRQGGISHAAASFLFHLGDVVYKPDATSDAGRDEDASGATAQDVDQSVMYDDQFYAQFAGYHRPIFAVAGNHDGKYSQHGHRSAIHHFLRNFCASGSEYPQPSKDNHADERPAMIQPYVYWRLKTPLADFIGLYSNIANGGILDDPSRAHHTPQYDWLVAQLKDVKRRLGTSPRKALLLAVHYPPYSGAGNFAQRGDPTLGPTGAVHAHPLAMDLQRAFQESGQRPDVVLSAHAHLYQRLTYRYADGAELPLLVAGSGGHAPVESLWLRCDGKTSLRRRALPFEAVLPRGCVLPAGESAQVVAHDDQSFGFLRLTVAADELGSEFFTVQQGSPVLADAFRLDLRAHRLV
jgi:acid phosphatase type 7